MESQSLAREYYRAIDEGDYEALTDLLAPDFVHDRPDRSIEGREAFVRFMREERPETDTTHEVDALYRGGDRVAAEGRLVRSTGEVWFRFVDVFTTSDGTLTGLTTYTH
ncbi:nuclear transport factor 2 family protein [Halomarina litorea]|uniref:nuclear transport factor 2 family protein n=1 Tax=Halomarina litorea TaxID=2961595 RepID=UPI0020C1C270|nr:nuclear transport factor 2 family protein [Halomarina sp. BCD28]